jgi:hypothetical protein
MRADLRRVAREIGVDRAVDHSVDREVSGRDDNGPARVPLADAAVIPVPQHGLPFRRTHDPVGELRSAWLAAAANAKTSAGNRRDEKDAHRSPDATTVFVVSL